MLANRFMTSTFKSLNQQSMFLFSAKKKTMQLTLRTPYKTIAKDFTHFSRIITKDLSEIVIIQNRNPPAIHVLPPGYIKLKLTSDSKGMAEEFIHTGGWAIIHNDNSVEINLMDAVEKEEVQPQNIDKVELKVADSTSGKYITKVRKAAVKNITKRLI